MHLNNSSLPLLAAHRVSFAYDKRPILQNVSLAIEAGEMVGLIGANGSGKSTLLRVLLGLLPRTAGEVHLASTPLDTLTRREIARRATLTPQDTGIDFAFTAREVVAMGRTPHLGRFSAEKAADREAIQRAMRATETEDFATRSVKELSGGQRQRVHLARALAQDTRVIILDEPTANLDLAYQFEALSLVRDATYQGKAALVALHDLTLAARFCDRLLLLAEGRLVAAGAPAEVITEDNLRQHFQLHARVHHDAESGGLLIDALGTARPAQCVARRELYSHSAETA